MVYLYNVSKKIHYSLLITLNTTLKMTNIIYVVIKLC